MTQEGKLSDAAEQSLFHTLFAHTRDVILVLTGGGAIQYQSPATEHVLGYTPGTLLGRSCFDFVYAEERPILLESFASLHREPGTPIPCEFRFWHHDAAWRVMEGLLHNRLSHPSIGGIVLTMQDLTERKQIEQQLRSSEAKNRALLEAIPDLMFFIDRNGAVGTFKSTLVDWLPTLEEAPGQRQQYTIHRPHELVDLTRSHAQNVLESSQPVFFECRLSMEERHHDYEVRVVPSDTHEALAIVRDITEKNRLQIELLESNRMAELGTLVASLGHEINNPLTYMLGHLEEICDILGYSSGVIPMDTRDKLHELSTEALEGAQRIRVIAQDLKTYTRLESTTVTAIDVHQSLDKVLHMLANEIRHRAHLERDYQAIPHIQAEPGRLEQVFLNLLLNAAQSMPDDKDKPRIIRVHTCFVEHERCVAISISDTGIGISPEHLSHIFEPFFTTKPVGAGTGLGLFVCRNIVLSQGGTLDVRSTMGEGTTFIITMPVKDTLLHPPNPSHLRYSQEGLDLLQLPFTPPPSTASSMESHSLIPAQDVTQGDMPASILIIDDEPRVAKSLKRVLRDYQATTVNSGEEALALMQASHYDLVFCDLLMPDLIGPDVYEQICQQKPTYRERFIFVTGGAFTERTRTFCEQTKQPVLEKPFDRKAIRDLTEKMLLEKNR